MYLDQWYQHAIGQRVAKIEQHWLQLALTQAFGYYIVQLGHPQQGYIETSPIQRKIYFTPEQSVKFAHITGEYERLPFASASIDVLVMAHTLEFCHDPFTVLAEAHRCLLPEGKLFILAFNSVSLLGLQKSCHIQCKTLPQQGQFIRPARLRSWLHTLDYAVDDVVSLIQRPLIKSDNYFNKLVWLEKLGERCWPEKAGCYAVAATKCLAGLTPRHPKWHWRKVLVDKTPASPTWRVGDSKQK